MKYISFYTDEGRFNFRVAAYVTCGDQVLLQQTDNVDFLNLIGGRVHMGESTLDAIKREVKEEIGFQVKNPKLLLIAENFFEWQGKNVHEMLFIYKIEIAKKYYQMLNNKTILDHNNQRVFWVEKSKIRKYNCRPVLVYKLPKLENSPNIIHTIGN